MSHLPVSWVTVVLGVEGLSRQESYWFSGSLWSLLRGGALAFVFIVVYIGARVLFEVLLMLISDFGRVLDGSGIFFSCTSSLWVP